MKSMLLAGPQKFILPAAANLKYIVIDARGVPKLIETKSTTVQKDPRSDRYSCTHRCHAAMESE